MTDTRGLTGIQKFKNHSAFKLKTKPPALERARPLLLLRKESQEVSEQRESPEFGAKPGNLSGNPTRAGISNQANNCQEDLSSNQPSFSLCDKRVPSKSFKLDVRDRLRKNSSDSQKSSQASTGQGNQAASCFKFLDSSQADRMTKQRSQIFAQPPFRTPEDSFDPCKSQISNELSKPSQNYRSSIRPSTRPSMLSVDIFARPNKSDVSFARIDPVLPEHPSEKEKNINAFLDKLHVYEHDFKRVLQEGNRIYSSELDKIRRRQSSQTAFGCNPKQSSASLSVLRQKRLLQFQKRADSSITSNTPNEFTLDDTPKVNPLPSFNSARDDDQFQDTLTKHHDHTIHECSEESPKKLGELAKKQFRLDDAKSSESCSDIYDSLESDSSKQARNPPLQDEVDNKDSRDIFYRPSSTCDLGDSIDDLESAQLKQSRFRQRTSRNQSQKQQLTVMDSSPELGLATAPDQAGGLEGESALDRGHHVQQQKDYSLLLATMGKAESSFKSETVASRDLFAGSGLKCQATGEQQSPFFKSRGLQME